MSLVKRPRQRDAVDWALAGLKALALLTAILAHVFPHVFR